MKFWAISATFSAVILAVAACGGQELAQPAPTAEPAATSAAIVAATGAPPVAAERATVPAPLPTATPLPVATLAPIPTSTTAPLPNPTPLPQAPTPVPTATPTPTLTPTPSPTVTPTPIRTTTPTSPPEPSPASAFSSGIYYTQSNLGSFERVLTKLEETLPGKVSWSGPGFDIMSDAVVFTDTEKVFLIDPDGRERQIKVEGIFQIARPSFSPDGKSIAVQAVESPGGDLNIYTVNLETGEAKRISFLDVNEESPEWFPNQNKIAYTSFHPIEGLTLHVYDVDAGNEVLSIRDGGWIHLTVSPDGSLLFNPILGRLYDAATGNIISDFKNKMLAGAQTHGYKPDTRFPGQAGLGTFPMDADFSPDGNHIVFDGAVEKDGEYGIVIFRMTRSGDDVIPLTDIIEVDPAISNNNNFSQLNPSWLGE